MARSSGSELDEIGDWEVVEEANIAVDYSNVRVFLETLQAWQAEINATSGQEAAEGLDTTNPDLLVNLDQALCD